MRARSARGLVAVIALALSACATLAASGPAAARSAARSTEVIRLEGNHLVGEASPTWSSTRTTPSTVAR